MKNLRYNNICLRALTILCLMMASVGAWAQWTDSHGVTFTATSGSAGNNNEGYGNVCDGNTGTKFCGNFVNGNCWVIVQASQPVKLTGYSLFTANDTQGNPGRNPRTWTIEGSNDGTNWHTFVTENNNAAMGATNYTEYFFTCSAPDYYQYFRLTITGLQNGNLFQYSEFHPFGLVEGMESSSRDGYVMFSGSNYLDNSTAGTTTFNPSTCIWRGTSGGTFFNGTNYIRNSNAIIGTDSDRNCTLGGTESGTTGQTLYTNSRYLRFNNGWTRTSSATDNGLNVVFAVTKDVYSEISTAPTISGANVFDATGNKTYSKTNASFTQGYIDYIFYNNTHHYFKTDNSTSLNAKPTAESFTYTWSLSANAAGHVSVGESSGIVSYDEYYADDTNVTLTLTAKSTNKTFTVTKTIKFEAPKTDPTSVSASNMTMNKGEKKTINVTLSPNPCYKKLDFSSSNTSVATVNATTGEVTGVAGGEATITIKAYHIDNNNFEQTTITVTVKEKVATPVITFTPQGEGNTASTTITCDTDGAKIYYTTDGTTPSASSTLYNGTFTVNNLDVVKAIAVKDGGYFTNSDVASATYSSHKVPTPTIIIDGNNVTFDCPEDGVTFYYTTDGSTPTTGSASWTKDQAAITTIPNEATIKVIAAKVGAQNSDVVERPFIRQSGVSGGTVYLNDYEDHTWTYYAGVEIGDYNTKNDYKGRLYSPNPRNVKITYLGKGKMRTGNDTSDLVDVPNTTRVSVGLGTESENTFIYYKTLERNANNRYEYTTIPNPFQVRPTYASDGTTKWRGFQSWRIKSIKKGAIYSAATGGTALAAGDMLNAETAYYFVPTDADGTGYTPNCTSMEIELEAVWARAYVDNSTNVGYERNFRMITANSNAAPTTYTYPTTYTSVYPNGCTTATGNTLATGAQYRIGSAFTAVSDTKFEYVILRNSTSNTTNATNTIDAACHNLVIGRGVVGYNGGLCATEIRGYAANDMDFTLRIESGSYTTFHALRSGGQTYSGICKVRSILGCDYDRVKKDNSKLNISTNMWMGQACKFSTAENRTQGFYKCWIKSGDLLSGVTVNGSNGTGGTQAFYYGTSGNQSTAYHIFPRYMYMEGGQVAGLAGGLDDRSVTTDNEQRVYLRMTGGFVRGPIYGAGAYAVAAGRRNYILTGGEVGGWIAAGCNGIGNNTSETQNGTTTGDSFVYIGGTVRVGYKGTTVNSVEGGNVFGAGRGAPVTTYDVGTVNNSNVVIADEAMIEKNVYGGGNYGFSKGEANIYITGGTVDGKVFGGSNMMKGDTPNMYMTGGLVKQGVYGGCNTEGTIAKNVTMNIVGGQVGTDGIQGNVHGGGLGNATVVSGKVDLTIGGTTPKQPVIYGNVYGGSESGDVNGNAYSATNTNTTKVTLNNGIINGSLYGGAWGRNREAFVYGPVTVTVNGGTVTEAVYGCNNAQGRPRLGVDVIINGTDPAPAEGQYALKNVFGGGNAANYTYTINNKVYPTVTVNNCDNSIEYVYGGGNAATVPGTDVTIHGGNVIGNVFGGGYGANITTKGTKVTIDGGTILNVYGGSNSSGTITGGIAVNINEANETSCPINIDNVFGGGNKAASAVGAITIGCASHIGSVYGGANQADVTSGNVNLLIEGGNIDNVFGGNNLEGNISGTITVTIDENKTKYPCGMTVGNVFGGGNLATLSKGPTVNILNGHITGNVFGGGKGDPADHTKGQVTGNPTVTIGTTATGKTVTIDGDVYGGGDAGNVVGTPVVTVVNNCDNKIANLYGGGNAADVNGTNVTINGGTFSGMVFGGGHGDKDAEPQKEANVKGNVALTITGGTISKVFAGSNSKGAITGTANLTVNKGASSCDLHITELYGGGNEAAGNAGTIKIQNTGGADEGIGTVYGGANNADINSSIALNITGGNIGDIFGGNNNGGQVKGDITVDINWSGTGVNHVGNVYGGGNIASIDNGTPRIVTVNIPNATVSGSVFGGGKGKEAVIVGSTNVNIGSWTAGAVTIAGADAEHPGDVFGGGDLAAVEGDCSITIRDCNTLITGDLYGGGNAAPVYSTNTTMWGGLVAGNVFGGGNGADPSKNSNGAQVGYKRDDSTAGTGEGKATTNIFGGTVGTWSGDGNTVCANGTGGVFGGSNTNGNIRGGIALTLDQRTCGEIGATQCGLKLREIYGAGNQAAYAGTGIDFDLGCVDYLEQIYGGAKAADLEANAVLNIQSGHFKQVFGGNNESGKLMGSITINVEETGCNPIVIDELYGGGNLAAYSVYGYEDALDANGKVVVKTSGDAKPDPQINIVSCTHIGKIFGGGLGKSAVMVGNPIVSIQEVMGDFSKRHYDEANKTVSSGTNGETDELGSIGTVFGGGNEAEVIGSTYINVATGKDAEGNTLYEADGTTPLTVGANITGNIYGGGNAADVTGKTNVTIGK